MASFWPISRSDDKEDVRVRFTYTGLAEHLTLMYNDDSTDMAKSGGGQFVAEVTVPEGKLRFSFIVDGQQFRVAANHPCSEDECQNVVEVKRKRNSVLQEIKCTGYSFDERVSSTSSQYTAGGSSACTPIAMEAISRLLAGKMTTKVKASTIDSVVTHGSKLYNQLASVCQSMNVDHLMPSEVYHYSTELSKGMDYIGWCSGDRNMDNFTKIHDVAKWSTSTKQGVGATLTAMNVTLCIYLAPDKAPLLFDSHSMDYGDDEPHGASLFKFKDMSQLEAFLGEKFPQTGLNYAVLSQYELNVFAKRGMRAAWQEESEALFNEPTAPEKIASPEPLSESASLASKIKDWDRTATTHANQPLMAEPKELGIFNPWQRATDNGTMSMASPKQGSKTVVSPVEDDLCRSWGPAGNGRMTSMDGDGLLPTGQSSGSNGTNQNDGVLPHRIKALDASLQMATSIDLLAEFKDVVESTQLLCNDIAADVQRLGAGPLWVARVGLLNVVMGGLEDRLEILRNQKNGQEFIVQLHALREFLEMANFHVQKFDVVRTLDSVTGMKAKWTEIEGLWCQVRDAQEGMALKLDRENRATAPQQSGSGAIACDTPQPHDNAAETTGNPNLSSNQANGPGNGSKDLLPPPEAGTSTIGVLNTDLDRASDHSGVHPIQSNRGAGQSGRVRGEMHSTPAPRQAVDSPRREFDQYLWEEHCAARPGNEQWKIVPSKSKEHDGDSLMRSAGAVSGQLHTRHIITATDHHKQESNNISLQKHGNPYELFKDLPQDSIPSFENGRFYQKEQGEKQGNNARIECRNMGNGRGYPGYDHEYTKCGGVIWSMLKRQNLLKYVESGQDISTWSLTCSRCATELVSTVLLISMETCVHDVACNGLVSAFGFSDAFQLSTDLSAKNPRIICSCGDNIGIITSKESKRIMKCGVCKEIFSTPDVSISVNLNVAESKGDMYYFLYCDKLNVRPQEGTRDIRVIKSPVGNS